MFLDELRRRRKEIKKLNQKLDETKSSIQGIELSVEIMEQGYKEINNSIKHLPPKETQ
ncbi:hypothetical protein [Clostridium boliviensis]|uniref:hypothetical protein n=1 Tax=Clostridium boliviensis TaxID=318465 RepID=UPI00296447C6|nr:hypothetical protein [Clostridium boliviensis]